MEQQNRPLPDGGGHYVRDGSGELMPLEKESAGKPEVARKQRRKKAEPDESQPGSD